LATSIDFDGESRVITTDDVTCTNQPSGGLVILVNGGSKRFVRVQLTHQSRLIVQKVGIRYDDLSGFVADPGEVTATKVDEAYTFDGRMPPNAGESHWHFFTIDVTCPRYQDVAPSPPYLPSRLPWP
jgi:hypothetical protein